MSINRPALGLAAVLAATVLTGGAAILGLVQRSVTSTPATAPAVVVQQAPVSQQWDEGGD